jgi:hypothetical protein
MRSLLILFFLALPATGHASVWLAAVDSYAQPTNPTGKSFMQFFAPGAAWNTAASRIQVFKVSTQFLHQASDAEVSAVIRGLQNRHIALGMEGLLLVASDRCGRGKESYSNSSVTRAVAERVKRLGGAISDVAMDEPLWFGNFREGPGFCHDPIQSLASQMAASVDALKAAFPAIRFGDIEPVNGKTVGRIGIILQFAQAFKTATGEPLSFVDADIIWQENWKPQLVEWKAKLHAAGIGFGVIFDGDPRDASDAAWTGHALERYRAVIADPATRPDDAIFQSWMQRPAILPDTAPDTLTGVVRRALQ